jgi:protein involved in polysaccharide export with SLBB domain
MATHTCKKSTKQSIAVADTNEVITITGGYGVVEVHNIDAAAEIEFVVGTATMTATGGDDAYYLSPGDKVTVRLPEQRETGDTHQGVVTVRSTTVGAKYTVTGL